MILPAVLLLVISHHNLIDVIFSTTTGSSSLSSSVQPINPFFIRLINSVLMRGNLYLASFVGVFGWGSGSSLLPLYFVYLYLIVLIFVSILDRNTFELSLKQKIASFFTFFVGMMIVFFVASTWTQSDTIWGVMGRYFIPFTPLFFLILSNKKKNSYYFKYIYIYIYKILILILMLSTYYLYNIGVLI
jgi:hypothetical protein